MDFDAAYRAHAAAVYRFCLTQLPQPASAEDAAADAFSAALRSWHRVDHRTDVRQWLFRIARNVITDHYRATRRRERLQFVLAHLRRDGAVPDPEAAVTLREDVRRVSHAIGQLRRRDQVLIGLRISSDLSHGEIARIMGMSEESARVAVHRALKKIRQELENEA